MGLGKLGEGQVGRPLTPPDASVRQAMERYECVTGHETPPMHSLIHMDEFQRVLGKRSNGSKASKFVVAAKWKE